MSSVMITGGGLVAGMAADLPSALRRLAEERGPASGPMTLDPRALFGQRNFRPLDRTGRLATAAVGAALEDAVLVSDARQLGLIVGTMFGSVETIAGFDRRALEAGPAYAKPMDFANSVINAAAGQVAIWYGLEGLNTTVSAGTASGLQALGMAYDAVRAGRAPGIVAGGVDEFSPAVRAAMAAANGNHRGATTGPPSELAEAACFWVLETSGEARRRGARGEIEICGWATGHLTQSARQDRDRAAGVLADVIAQALEEAGLSFDRVGLASIGASSTFAQDVETLALARVFGADLPRVAIKATSGECLGASGALQLLPALALARGLSMRLVGERSPRPLPATAVTLLAVDPHGPVTVVIAAPHEGGVS